MLFDLRCLYSCFSSNSIPLSVGIRLVVSFISLVELVQYSFLPFSPSFSVNIFHKVPLSSLMRLIPMLCKFAAADFFFFSLPPPLFFLTLHRVVIKPRCRLLQLRACSVCAFVELAIFSIMNVLN